LYPRLPPPVASGLFEFVDGPDLGAIAKESKPGWWTTVLPLWAAKWFGDEWPAAAGVDNVPIIAATTSNFFIAGSPVVETYRRSRKAVIYSR
jgi:hypothetical protein